MVTAVPYMLGMALKEMLFLRSRRHVLNGTLLMLLHNFLCFICSTQLFSRLIEICHILLQHSIPRIISWPL